MKTRKRFGLSFFFICLLSLTMFLTACGDPTATQAPATTTVAATTPSATTASNTASTTSATTTAQVASSGHPGIMKEAWYGPDPATLDPQAVQPAGYTTRYMYGNLYLGLTDYDEKANIIPGIAREWKASADSLVWTFTLNPAAKFSSGKSVTAADVAYSYERAASPALKSASNLQAVGDILGANDKFAGKADKIAGLKVVNDTTLEITLASPNAIFPAKLATSYGAILDKDVVESGVKWWETKSAGAGPFQLAEWTHGQKIVLTPNPNWFGPKVKLTRVEYMMVGDQTNRLNLFESGQTDVHWQLLTSEIEYVKKNATLSKTLTELPFGMNAILYLGFNTKGYEPFKDAKVRQAVAMALDAEIINGEVLNGQGIKATGLIPSGVAGFKTGLMKTTYDPTAAKKLLVSAGYADPAQMPVLTLTQVGTGPDIAGTMQYVQNSLKTQLGMKVEIQVTDQQSFVPMLMQGKVSAWATLMFMGYADQYAALSNFSSKSPNNVYGYANPEVDALLLQSVTVQDTKARETLYNQIESKLLEDMPVMPIMWGKFYVMQRPYVSGYRVNVLGIMPFTNVEVK